MSIMCVGGWVNVYYTLAVINFHKNIRVVSMLMKLFNSNSNSRKITPLRINQPQCILYDVFTIFFLFHKTCKVVFQCLNLEILNLMFDLIS